jgi:hypothetical protein
MAWYDWSNTSAFDLRSGPVVEDQTQFHLLGLGLQESTGYQLIVAERRYCINHLLCSFFSVLLFHHLIYLLKPSLATPVAPCTQSAASRPFWPCSLHPRCRLRTRKFSFRVTTRRPFSDPRCSDSNVTLTFSDGHDPAPRNISFSMWDKPRELYASTCFNIADVFGNTTKRPIWDYSVGDVQDYSINTTWTTMTYRQLNQSEPKVGKDAARLVKIHAQEDCVEDSYQPWHGFSCQDAGSYHIFVAGIKSFSVLDRGYYDYEDSGHCWVNAERGQSAASTNFKGCLVALMAASLAGMLLAL